MNNRIGYIDTAKGLCILLVMMIHIGIPEPIPNIYSVKVALFFVLSGFFMKESLPPFTVTAKKGVNRLIIPFLFFYLFSYAVFYVGGAVYPALYNMTEATGVFDCFTQKQYFNGPLWFLPCLFSVQIITWCFFKLTTSKWLRCVGVLLIGCLGFLLSILKVDLPLALDTALVAVPMYVAGYLARKIELFERYTVPSFIMGSAIYVISIITPPYMLQCP